MCELKVAHEKVTVVASRSELVAYPSATEVNASSHPRQTIRQPEDLKFSSWDEFCNQREYAKKV